MLSRLTPTSTPTTDRMSHPCAALGLLRWSGHTATFGLGHTLLTQIAVELAAQGFINDNGRPFNPASVAAMLVS